MAVATVAAVAVAVAVLVVEEAADCDSTQVTKSSQSCL